MIYGLYRGPVSDVFAVSLGGATHRPDGRALSLSFSSQAGVPAAERGLIRLDELLELPAPIKFTTRLILHPMRTLAGATSA